MCVSRAFRNRIEVMLVIYAKCEFKRKNKLIQKEWREDTDPFTLTTFTRIYKYGIEKIRNKKRKDRNYGNEKKNEYGKKERNVLWCYTYGAVVKKKQEKKTKYYFNAK